MNNTFQKYKLLKYCQGDLAKYLLLGIFILVLNIILFKEIELDAFNLIFSDQIDLFAGYFANPDFLQLFMQQHGPHRQGLGAFFMFPVLKISQWNVISLSYLTLFFMTLSAMLFSIAMIARKEKVITILAVVAIILSFGSLELITITPNISHSVLPLFFTSMIVLASTKFDITSYKFSYSILCLSILSLFTGFGLFLFLTYLILEFLSYFLNYEKINFRDFGLKISIIGLSISTFFFEYSFNMAEGCSGLSINTILPIVKYTFALASIPLGGNGLGPYSFFIGFLMVTGYCFVGIKASNRYFIIKDRMSFAVLFLIITSLLFMVNASFGRHCLGFDTAYSSRYYFFSSLGLIGVFLSSHLWRSHISKIIFTMLAILVFISQTLIIDRSARDLSRGFSNHKRSFVECVKSGLNVSECNLIYPIYPPDSSKLNEYLTKFNQI